MINTNVLKMLSVLNEKSAVVLDIVYNHTLETEQFTDLDSLDDLNAAGWIKGCSNGHPDDCVWIMTVKGRKLFEVINDLIV